VDAGAPAFRGEELRKLRNIPPAEAWLRLSLHPIRRIAQLSLVLSRPDGFPERITAKFDGLVEVSAYDASRYDDIDLEWRPELLADELRYESREGVRWVRSARRIHIFAGDPSEPDLVSVSAARAGAEHAVVCRAADAGLVEEIALQSGSPPLLHHDHWQGIPDGWRILSGYIPAHASGEVSDPALKPLDPGFDIRISLAGGLEVRTRVFAQRHPPRIEIPALPAGVSVFIGGQEARPSDSGSWEAPGWDDCGQHTVDVMPGPSLTYEIAADPAGGAGWPFWDAHEHRFAGDEPWACAQICGAAVAGPQGEMVIAYEVQPTLIALGAHRHATALRQRTEAGVSVAVLPEAPEFLIAARGQRRRQGKVVWLGLDRRALPASKEKQPDLAWADAVHSAASRRLPFEGYGGAPAKSAWQSAVRRARSLRKRRA
jgi:hypothetical protein